MAAKLRAQMPQRDTPRAARAFAGAAATANPGAGMDCLLQGAVYKLEEPAETGLLAIC